MSYKYLILSLIFAFAQCTCGYAQSSEKTKNDKPGGVCLEVVGLALEKHIPLDGVMLRLFKENEEVVWEEITCVPYHEHTFTFDLLCDSHYSIEISKEGYWPRLVSIFTELPPEAKGKKYLFEFEVELIKKVDSLDIYYSDFPVAIISYNKKTKIFEHHRKYTRKIKGKLKEEIFIQSRSKKK